MTERCGLLLMVGVATLTAACGESNDGNRPSSPPRNFGAIGLNQVGGLSYGWATYENYVESSCQAERFGDCSVSVPCDAPFPPVTFFDAGTVTVQGTPLELSTSYYAALPVAVLPGERVEMAATGSSDVPAHRGTVVLPEPVTFTEPALDGSLSVDRASDLHVAWTPINDGHVYVSLSTGESGATTAVSCSVNADAGRLTMPKAALQMLAPTTPEVPATFAVNQGEVITLSPKGWEILLVTGETTASASAMVY